MLLLNMIKNEEPEPLLRQRVTAKAEGTRERIVAAALDLFRENGFDHTTMRDVSARAGVATGAAYYYFRSKEELVMAFYLRTAEEMVEVLPEELARTRDLRKRIALILDLKLEQFREHRSFLGALVRTGVDPKSPLSPFSEETRAIREESIDWFRKAIDGSSASIPRDLDPYLPKLLWLYQMGLLLHWLYDRSPGQVRTARITSTTLDCIVRGIRMSTLPLMGAFRRPVVQLLKYLEEEQQ